LGLRVLVLSAHIDDAECGAGGTVARHIERGDNIQWHTLVRRGYQLPENWPLDTLELEFQFAMAELGIEDYHLHDFKVDTLDAAITAIRDKLYKLWHDFDPDMAYIPWNGSRHQDHKAVGEAALQVSWRTTADVFMYVVVNDYLGFVPNTYSILADRYYRKKLLVLQCYRSQLHMRPWFTETLVESHARAFAIFAEGENSHIEPFIQAKRVLI